MKLPRRRYVLSVLALALLVGGFWVYRLIWGRPLDVDHFFERVFLEWFLTDPELMSQLGVLDGTLLDYWSDDLTDASPAWPRRLHAKFRRDLDTLRAYDRGALSEEQRLSYDVLEWYLDDKVRGEPYLLHEYRVNQLESPHTFVPEILTRFHRVEKRAHAESFLARLAKIGVKLEQAVEGLRRQEEIGVVLPRFLLARVLDQTREFTAPPIEENALYVSFVERLGKVDGLDAAAAAQLAARARREMERTVYPAYRAFAAYLERLATRAGEDAGVWRLPDGEAYYAYLLRHYTTTELSPGELHRQGLDAVARLEGEMRELLASLGHEGRSVAEHMRELAEDPRFHYPDDDAGRAAALADFQAIVDEIDRGLAGLFNLRPVVGVRAERMPVLQEDEYPLAFYIPPSLDGVRPGVLQVNLRDMREIHRFGMRTLAYHEAVPGHHFQKATALGLAGVPTFRKILPDFAAYIEGWALYAERLAWEQGFQDDPYDNLGRLQAELWRAVRLVVDTGIHQARWSREEAIRYMLDHLGLLESEIVSEVERYVVAPGQACSYYVGLTTILELRARSRRELGERFDLAGFHDAVLRHGQMPLEILERVVDEHGRQFVD